MLSGSKALRVNEKQNVKICGQPSETGQATFPTVDIPLSNLLKIKNTMTGTDFKRRTYNSCTLLICNKKITYLKKTQLNLE